MEIENKIRPFVNKSRQSEDWIEKVQDFFTLFFEEDLDKNNAGYIFINKINKGKKRKIIRCSQSYKMADSLPALYFSKANYYTVKNRFKDTAHQDMKHLFGYSAIVIDNDLHARKKGTDEVLEVLNDFLFVICDSIEDYNLPCPNAIVYTGRGLQLWWKVEPCSAKNHKIFYDTVAASYVEKIRDFLSARPRFADLNVDAGASTSASGLVRLPGSYNTHSKNYGDFLLLHADSIDIYEEANRIWETSHQTTEFPKCLQKSSGDASMFAIRRENQLKKLLFERQQSGCDSPEFRDLFLFSIFNAFMTACGDESTAFAHVFDFNKLFRHPQSRNEVSRSMSTSKRKGGYYISNACLIRLLDITAQEQDLIGLHPSAENADARKRKKEQLQKSRDERDALIISLCQQGVPTKTAIAKAVGCSVATVMRVLRAAGLLTEKEKKHIRLLVSFEQGTSFRVLMKIYKGKISRSGLYYILKKAKRKLQQRKTSFLRKRGLRKDERGKECYIEEIPVKKAQTFTQSG